MLTYQILLGVNPATTKKYRWNQEKRDALASTLYAYLNEKEIADGAFILEPLGITFVAPTEPLDAIQVPLADLRIRIAELMKANSTISLTDLLVEIRKVYKDGV